MVALAVFAATAVVSTARVYSRVGAAADVAAALEALGGRSLYTSAVTINGGDGELNIHGFDDPIGLVADAVGQAFDAPALAGADGGMAIALVDTGETTMRFVVVEMAPAGGTLVFALRQSAAEAAKSATPPDARRLAGRVPLFPGAAIHFAAIDDTAHAALVVSDTATEPEIVRAHFDDVLPRGAWQRVGPPARTAWAGFVAFYIQGPRLCVVAAAPGANGAGTRITVLHKRLVMK
jgi:hypothetical protein